MDLRKYRDSEDLPKSLVHSPVNFTFEMSKFPILERPMDTMAERHIGTAKGRKPRSSEGCTYHTIS